MIDEDEIPTNATIVEGFAEPGLPKWPAHVVTGQSVTPEQARAVIIRTTAIHYLSGNDRAWDRQVHEAFGFEVSDIGYPISPCFRDDEHDHYWQPRPDDKDKTPRQMCSPVNKSIMEQLGILSLSYIENDRISSSYIGGPNGWMDWDGTIRQTDKNVGKWPGTRSILQDWAKVAEAFPFLDITATLWSGEQCEDNTRAVVEYRIKDGHVTMGPPSEDTEPVDNKPFDGAAFMRKLHDPRGERGCSPDLLRQAIEDARASVGGQPA